MRAEPEPAHVCPPRGHWGAGGCEHAVQPAAAPRGVVPTSAGPQTHWEAPGTQPRNTQAPQPTPWLPSSPLGGWGEVGCSWTGPRLPLCLKTLAYGGGGELWSGDWGTAFHIPGRGRWEHPEFSETPVVLRPEGRGSGPVLRPVDSVRFRSAQRASEQTALGGVVVL